jgi:hypothetical protein
MELHELLSNPMLWLIVAAGAVFLSGLGALLSRILASHAARRSRDSSVEALSAVRTLRLLLLAAGMLALANLAALGVLAMPNLVAPRLAGPVGLSLLALLLSTLTLGWLLWLGSNRE